MSDSAMSRLAGSRNYDTVHADGMLVTINGKFVDADFLQKYTDQIYTYIGRKRHRDLCPFCGTGLLSTNNNIEFEKYRGYRSMTLDRCENCVFWEVHHELAFFDGEPEIDSTLCLSKIRSFEESLPAGCEDELAQHLRRDPFLWHTLPKRRMEELVRDIFRANHADAEAIHVGRPHDGGVDVIFVDAAKTQWLIQVKCRESPDYVERVGTLINMLGVLVTEGQRHGIVVSTCDHFTYRVYKDAGRAKTNGFTVELVDRGVLNRMIGRLLPDSPWRDALHQLDASLATSF